MKKSVSISLIILLIVPFWLSLTLLHFEKKEAQKEAKWAILNGLEKEKLVSLRFSRDEIKTMLKWKHDKEFRYKDIMYDIVRSEETPDSVFYWCWEDTRESLIEFEINNLLAQNDGKSGNKGELSKRLNQFFSNLYPAEKKELLLNDNVVVAILISDNQKPLSSLHKPLTPPPRA